MTDVVQDGLASAVEGRLDLVAQAEPRIRALLPEPGRRARLLASAAKVPIQAPLRGLFAGVKDIFHVRGLPTRAGTALPPELFPVAEDAACVAALRGAGALILGKTVTTEFAYFEPGPTRNPHDPEHTPGGSSSGSAAAVAAGYCELALGTQTVGSVIRPAAFCGVVGYKPSYGRVPTDGLLLCSPSVDTIGLFAPDLATVTRGAAVIVEGWRPLADDGNARPVFGVPEGPYLQQASPQGLSAFVTQIEWLVAAGLRVERLPALADIADVNERHSLLQAAEMAREHAAWMTDHLDLYRPRTRELLLRGREIGDARLAAARAGRAALRDRLHEMMAAAGIDAWICPAATGPAPRGLASTGDPIMNLPWTHAGLPALSLPAGRLGRLPLGLQCVGAHGRDESLLASTRALAAKLSELQAL